VLDRGTAEVPVRVLVVSHLVGKILAPQICDGVDDQVQGFGGSHVVARGQDAQRCHVGAEQFDLLGSEFLPVLPCLGGALEQRVVHIGDVLHVVDRKPQVEPDPVQQVERQVGERVAEVGRVVGGDAANVKSGGAVVGADDPLCAGHCVEDPNAPFEPRIVAAWQSRNWGGRPSIHAHNLATRHNLPRLVLPARHADQSVRSNKGLR